MTRSQVRAAMRRMRDHNEEIEEEAGELNLEKGQAVYVRPSRRKTFNGGEPNTEEIRAA